MLDLFIIVVTKAFTLPEMTLKMTFITLLEKHPLLKKEFYLLFCRLLCSSDRDHTGTG